MTKGPCNQGTCKIPVTVTGNCSSAADISAPDREVEKGSGTHNMEWTIRKSPGFQFVSSTTGDVTTGGTTFLAPPDPASGASPTSEFKNPHVTGNGLKYIVHNENSASVSTTYKYAIHLKRDDGTLCAVKDPTIVNGK